MKVKGLKELLAKLPDDAEVLARSRDCISLECVDIVGAQGIEYDDDGTATDGDITYHRTMETVYGGGDNDDPKAAIIFCECD